MGVHQRCGFQWETTPAACTHAWRPCLSATLRIVMRRWQAQSFDEHIEPPRERGPHDREEDEDHDARRRVGNEQLYAHQGPTPRWRTAIERDIRERARDTRQAGADEVHHQARYEPRDLTGTGVVANSHAAVRPVEIAPAPTRCDPRR